MTFLFLYDVLNIIDCRYKKTLCYMTLVYKNTKLDDACTGFVILMLGCNASGLILTLRPVRRR